MKKSLLFLLILIFFTACEKEQKPAQPQSKTESQKPVAKPKHFVLRDHNRTIQVIINKNSVELKGTKSVTLVLFFTSWCPSCKAELQELKELYPKYKEKLDIVGIQLDNKAVDAPFFISRDIKTNEAVAKEVYTRVHAPASMPIPLSLLLKNNNYVIHYVGAVPMEMIEIDIKKALGEK